MDAKYEDSDVGSVQNQVGIDCSAATFQEGCSFQDFPTFTTCFDNWCKRFYHPMKVNKSDRNPFDSDSFPYIRIKYSCKHYGEPVSSGKGIRPNRKFLKISCPVVVQIYLDKKSCRYIVSKIMDQHNHPTSDMLYKAYSTNRRLTDSELYQVAELVKCDIGTNEIKEFIRVNIQKNLKSKDIHNLRAKLKTAERKNRTEGQLIMDSMYEVMKENPKFNAHLEVDAESTELIYAIFQSPSMKDASEKYGDVMFVDAIYNTNSAGFPLFMFMCEDEHGRGQPFAYMFAKNETDVVLQPAFQHLFDMCVFMKCKKTFFTEKDFVASTILRNLFPTASFFLCTTSVLKHMKMKIAKFHLSNTEKANLLKCFTKLLSSETLDSYHETLVEFRSLAPPEFVESFMNDWDSCKELWVHAFFTSNGTFVCNTNNVLESHKQKLRMCFKRHMHLSDSLKKLVSYMNALEAARVHNAVDEIKLCVNVNNMDDLHLKISSVCSSSAALLLHKELKELKLEDLVITNIDSDEIVVYEGQNHYFVSKDKWQCSCAFFSRYGLSCRHVMECRKCLNLEVFDVGAVPQRWRRKEAVEMLTEMEAPVHTTQIKSENRVPEKQDRADTVLKEMGRFLLSCGPNERLAHVHMLEAILKGWQENVPISIHYPHTSLDGKFRVMVNGTEPSARKYVFAQHNDASLDIIQNSCSMTDADEMHSNQFHLEVIKL